MNIKKIIIHLVVAMNLCAPIHAVSEMPEVIMQVAQAVKPHKSFLIKYEIDQVPAESGVYFQSIIDSYRARIKRDELISSLKADSAKGDMRARELVYLFELSASTTTSHQAVALLTRALTAHAGISKAYAGRSELLAAHERIYTALLMQDCVVLVNKAREQLLSLLDEITHSLLYWREQKNHPMKYFFHKSPLKWGVGKKQDIEVAKNIQKLERLQQGVRAVLGSMIKHVYNFDPASNTDQTYTWIEQLLQIVMCIGKNPLQQEHESRFDTIADNMRFKLSRVEQLKQILFSKVSSAHISGHFVRNWMAYTASIATIYMAYNYYGKNTKLVDDAVMRAIEALKDIARQIVDPVKNAWHTIFGETQQPQGYVSAVDFADITPVLTDSLKKLECNKVTFLKLIESDESFKEETMNHLRKTLQSGRHTYSGRAWGDKILEEVEKGNLKPLFEAADGLGWVSDTSLKADLSIDEAKLHYGLPLIEKAEVIQDIIINLVTLIDASGTATKRTLLWFDESSKWFEKNSAQSDLSLKLLTLIPASLLGFGTHKLYKVITAKDYSPIRLSLIEVNSLFIESPAPLGDVDYGKLIYLLQGLKVKAMHYLPVKNNVRDDFLVDIAKLESQHFTVDIKRRIIKNMFKKYSFLLSLSEKTA